jgi:hypothetical protein
VAILSGREIHAHSRALPAQSVCGPAVSPRLYWVMSAVAYRHPGGMPAISRWFRSASDDTTGRQTPDAIPTPAGSEPAATPLGSAILPIRNPGSRGDLGLMAWNPGGFPGVCAALSTARRICNAPRRGSPSRFGRRKLKLRIVSVRGPPNVSGTRRVPFAGAAMAWRTAHGVCRLHSMP